MYDYIRGTLTGRTTTSVTVEAGGVGYLLEIPLSTFEKLPDAGAPVKLLVHHHVRENVQKFYGFMTAAERDMFRELIGVSQIGPKVALSVLSGVPVVDLVNAIMTADAGRLRNIPGVGPKLVQRILMELKTRVKGIEPESQPVPSAPGARPAASARREAYDAMLALGYADRQVVEALDRVEKVVGADAPVEAWIRKALQAV